MVLRWRRRGRAGGCRHPFGNARTKYGCYICTLKTEYVQKTSKREKREIGRHQKKARSKRGRYHVCDCDCLPEGGQGLITKVKQKGRRADALAPEADEGREKLR